MPTGVTSIGTPRELATVNSAPPRIGRGSRSRNSETNARGSPHARTTVEARSSRRSEAAFIAGRAR